MNKQSKQNKLQRNKDFEQLAKIAQDFINKWGNPHSVIVIEQGSIQFYEGEMALPLKILD